MIVKGERFRVINDCLGHFKKGDIVISIEDDNAPYCVYEKDYEDEKGIEDYEYDKYFPMSANELEKIESEDK